MLTYANESLTYWLPDRMKIFNWFWKVFHDWVCQRLLKMHKSILDFTDFLSVSGESRTKWHISGRTFSNIFLNSEAKNTAKLSDTKGGGGGWGGGGGTELNFTYGM